MSNQDLLLLIVGILAVWMSFRIITYKVRKERGTN
jgi:hypothetical protein